MYDLIAQLLQRYQGRSQRPLHPWRVPVRRTVAHQLRFTKGAAPAGNILKALLRWKLIASRVTSISAS